MRTEESKTDNTKFRFLDFFTFVEFCSQPEIEPLRNADAHQINCPWAPYVLHANWVDFAKPTCRNEWSEKGEWVCLKDFAIGSYSLCAEWFLTCSFDPRVKQGRIWCVNIKQYKETRKFEAWLICEISRHRNTWVSPVNIPVS